MNNAFQNIPLVLTVEDVAKFLNIGRNTAYNLIHSGELKSIRVGRQIRITRDALFDYLGVSLN